MAGLKDQLEAAGYDTSKVDESQLLQKLDSAGYDTSKFQAPKPTTTAEGMKAAGIEPIDSNNSEIKKLGERVAEGLGSKGFNPKLAAAAGTALQMIPDVLMAGMGGGEAGKVAEAASESPVIKAFIPGAKQVVGKAIGEVDAQAGIKQIIPTVSNMAKRLDLPARERSFADIVNTVKGKLDGGEKPSLQDLSDFRDLVKQQFGAGKIAKGTRLEALTSGTNKQAGQALNDLIPGRAKLSSDYNTITQIQNGMKLLAKAGAGASGLGLSGLILKKLIKG